MPVNSGPIQERPLLTIAIPTFNRGTLLVELLDCLRQQIGPTDPVRLLISDNASTDHTEQIVEQEQKRGTRLDYIRNAENIGPDANFLQCYEQATGKYVWIISDDDLLLPGTVVRLLGYLQQDEYDLVFVEQAGFNGSPGTPSSKVPAKKAFVCRDASQYLRRVHIFTTLISCNIINKDSVNSIGHKPFSALVNSNLIQLGWTLTALRGHRKSLYIGDRLILYRLGNTGGYGVFRVFGENLARITEEWLGIPALNKIVLNASLQRLMPPFVLEAKKNAHGAYTQEDPRTTLSGVFRHNSRYWIFLYPLAALPVRLAHVWLQLVRVVNRVDRALGYPSLTW